MTSLVVKPSTLRQFQLKVTEAYMLLNEMNKNDVLTAMKLLLNLIERIGEILCDSPSGNDLVNRHDQSHVTDTNLSAFFPSLIESAVGQPSTSSTVEAVPCSKRVFYRKRKNPVPTRYVQSSFQKPSSSIMSKYRALSSHLGQFPSTCSSPHIDNMLRQSPGSHNNYTDNDTDGLSDSNTSGNITNDMPQDLSKSRSDRDENGNDAAFNVHSDYDINGAIDSKPTKSEENLKCNAAKKNKSKENDDYCLINEEGSPINRHSLSDGHHSPSERMKYEEMRPSSLSPYDLLPPNRNSSPKDFREQPVFPRMYLPDMLNHTTAAPPSSTDSGYPTTPTSIKMEVPSIPVPASDIAIPLMGNYSHDALATLRESASVSMYPQDGGSSVVPDNSRQSNNVPLSIPIPVPWVEKRKIAKYPGAFHNELHNDGRVNYRCGFCKKVIVFAEIFHRHLKSHVSKASNDCEICNINFAFRSNLFRHIRRYHIDYVCSLCKVTFAKPKQLEQHLQIYHADRSAVVKEVSLR